MNRILLLIVFVFLLADCQKKKDPPQLASISPESALIGDQITLSGSQFGDDPTVLIGSQSVAIDAHSSTSIRLTVPAMSPGPTTIRVQTQEGSSDPLPFTVLQSPSQVSYFNPTEGGRGLEVIISGANLEEVTEVRFSDGNSSPASFQLVDNTLRVIVPADAVSGSICLRSSTGLECSDQRFTVLLPPSLESISPEKGMMGTAVTLTGDNLESVQTVLFGSQPGQIQMKENNRIVVLCPEFSSVQTVSVIIQSGGGNSGEKSFTGAPSPTIDRSRSIPAGLIPGSALTLKGANFNNVTHVRFPTGMIPRDQFIRIALDEIIVKVPAGALNGLVQIVNEYGEGEGVNFDSITGGDGLNTGNVSTGVTTIVSSPLYDSCSPANYMFCYNGKWVIYPIKDNPVSSGSTQFCREGVYYSIETIGSSTYQVYSETRGGVPPPFTVKFELDADGVSFTGFVILIASSGDYFVGNIIKEDLPNSGDIIAFSPENGSVVRLCSYVYTGRNETPVTGRDCSVCK